jgi:DNA mismatch repair ATPase MutS
VGTVAGAFRQIAPVVATAERLGILPDELRRLRRLKNISRWISGDPLLIAGRGGALAVLFNDIVQVFYEYLNLAFLLDANGAYFGATELRTHRGTLLRVVAATGDVDVALSVSAIRSERSDWIRPRFQPPGAPAALVDVVHPLIPNAVPNSIVLETGQGILITGSNMSGKSTFLRAVGVNVVLAQTINTCFAAGYDAPAMTVASCIGRADDLLSGKSYYIVEAESLLELVGRSAETAPHLFLLDEVLRGTNAVERIAAGQAILRELVDSGNGTRRHFVIAATHDAELVEMLRDSYTPHHFSDAVGAEGLVFDHHLRRGAATTRNAIALLKLLGAPERMIARALTCAETLERQRSDAISRR